MSGMSAQLHSIDHPRPGPRPRVLLVLAPGTNCDQELERAFRLTGGEVVRVHLADLCGRPELLDGVGVLALPGGFSFGDDIASGRVFAMHVSRSLTPVIRERVAQGMLVLGVCNGFQVLVRTGLLPGWSAEDSADALQAVTTAGLDRSLALTDNASGSFIDAWSPMEAPTSSCLWTRGLANKPEAPGPGSFAGSARPGGLTASPRLGALAYPFAHAEGRLVSDDAGVIDRLEADGLVALRYADNPNGSARAIAGVCDPTGRVLGLMPHPERFLSWDRHPGLSDAEAAELDRAGVPTPGLRLFINGVASAVERC